MAVGDAAKGRRAIVSPPADERQRRAVRGDSTSGGSPASLSSERDVT